MLYGKVSKAINFVRVIRAQSRARYLHYKRQFVFTLRRKIIFRRRTKFKPNFINPRYLQNFYLVLTRNNFRRYITKAKRIHGYFIGNYLTFLEGRLYMMVYRSNFITNLFMIRNIVRKGIFNVNGTTRYHFNYVMKLGDILQVNFRFKRLIRIDLLMRLEQNIILWYPPAYLYPNFNFMFVMFRRKPKIKDLYFPIRIDLLIGSEYYMP
jgi:ribosomal protein S4